MSMRVVQQAWWRQSRTEYTAAALTAELGHWLIMMGLSPDTLQRCSRVVADEVEHAKICHRLYLHAGGQPKQVPIPPNHLRHADDPHADVVNRAISAVAGLAVEESVALPVFQTRLRNAADPVAVETIERILADEAFHRLFAWDTLDELIERLGVERVHAWVRPRAAWWMRIYLRASIREDEPTYSEEELSFGLIDRREHWSLMRACVEDTVVPRLQERGLLESHVTSELLLGELVEGPTGLVPPWAGGRASARLVGQGSV